MKEVTVNKAEALEALRTNRANHRAIFEEAVEGFKAAAQEALEAELKRVADGSMRQVYVHLPAPVDHTKDYDRAIKKLEMSVGDTVTLSEQDVAAYVMDDWGWKREFITSNAMYSATAAMSQDDL